QQCEHGRCQMQSGEGLDQMPELLMKMFYARINVQAEKVFPLTDKDDDGNTAGETDDNRVRDVFDNAAKTGQAHDQQNGAGHQCGYLQALNAIFGRDTSQNDDK